MRQIVIRAGSVEVRAELNESKTAQAIWQSLPVETPGNTWGDEIYFPIAVKMKTERGQETVDLGDLGYWEPGNAFCIFFGPTPMSYADEIRPASPVTVVGKVLDDPTALKSVRSGETIRIDRAESP